MNAPIVDISTAEPVCIDARLSFLARAAVRHELVESGELDLSTAFSELVEPFMAIVFPRPETDAEAYWDSPSWVEAAVAYREHPQSPRGSSQPRPTPQVTVEAIMYAVRERGPAALKEPANRARLSRCDAQARAEINRRVAALGIKGRVAA